MKTTISISNQLIPVYIMRTISKNKLAKLLDKLVATLEAKTQKGKQTVQKYLATLDSIEIDGSDAILYSKEYLDTLPLSLS
jgi:hypothetical protein